MLFLRPTRGHDGPYRVNYIQENKLFKLRVILPTRPQAIGSGGCCNAPQQLINAKSYFILILFHKILLLDRMAIIGWCMC